jgi:hypothetical protein
MNALKSARVEQLENRRLLSSVYGHNLVINGGAEQYDGYADGYNLITPADWTANGDATVARYNRGYAASIGLQRPANGGSVLFSGGPDQQSTDFFQTIDLSSIAADVDSGHVNFLLGGLLGGYSFYTDNAELFVRFKDASGTVIAQRGTGSVSASDRNDATELIGRLATGNVPATTRFAQVQIHFKRDSLDGYNDAFADNISFQVVTNTPSTSGVTPAITRSTLPATAISGRPARGAVVVSVTNTGTSINQGVDTITLFASSNGVIDSTSTPLASFRRRVSLNAGATKLLGFPLNGFPLPAGTYTILAQTIDRYLTVVNATAGPIVTVVPATVQLSASVAQPIPAAIKPGQFINLVLSVANTGNVNSTGIATIAISVAGVTNPNPVLIAKRVARLTLKPNGVALKLRLRVRIPATQPADTYTPVVTFTQGGNVVGAATNGSFVVT